MHSVGTVMRIIWRSSKRATVFVVGVALVVVGLIMFVTPGPGIVLVVAGLAVLATEFAWAEHLLDKAKEQAARAGQSAQRVPGVARVTSAAGRLVPRRWRRVTTVTVSTDTVTVDDHVYERTTVAAAQATIIVLDGDGADTTDETPATIAMNGDGADTTDEARAPVDVESADTTAAARHHHA